MRQGFWEGPGRKLGLVLLVAAALASFAAVAERFGAWGS